MVKSRFARWSVLPQAGTQMQMQQICEVCELVEL